MSKLRSLSGLEVLKILAEFGFLRYSQRGSHIKLRRVAVGGGTQTLTVPAHDEIDRGTLHAVYRQESRYVSEVELRGKFFTD